MSDIVKRLGKLEACERELAHEGDCPPEATANWAYADTCAEAAAEIERLKAEVERKDAALNKALPWLDEVFRWHRDMQSSSLKVMGAQTALEVVRAALTPSQEPRT